jgi:DNA-binding transcriptional LysR family regulator
VDAWIKVAGRFQTDGAQAANAAAVCGLGIGSAMLWQVNELIERGDVELALTRFEPPPMVIRAVWPSTKILLEENEAVRRLSRLTAQAGTALMRFRA